MSGGYWLMGLPFLPVLAVLQVITHFGYFHAYKDAIRAGAISRRECGIIVPSVLPAIFFLLTLGIALTGGPKYLEAFSLPLVAMPALIAIAIYFAKRRYGRIVAERPR